MAKILLVVDMQNDFVTGALGTQEAQAIVPNVIERIKEYEKDDDNYVIYTMDAHNQMKQSSYFDTIEGKHLPIPHCIWGTKGQIFIPEIRKVLNVNRTKTIVLLKETFGFDWHHFSDSKYKDIEQIEIIGLCTDFCVMANAFGLKAVLPNVPIIINSKCCAGSTPEWHREALDMLEHCHFDII